MLLLLVLAVAIPLLCLFHLMSTTVQTPRGAYQTHPLSCELRP